MKTYLSNRVSQYLHGFFLFSLVSLIVVPAFVIEADSYRFASYMLMSVVFLSGLTLLIENPSHWYLGFFFGIISISINWFSFNFEDSATIRALETPIFFIFFCILSYRMAVRVFTSASVTVNVILDSISGYFLLGIVGGMLCSFLFYLDPSSFSLPANSSSRLYDFVYYSFVTITTLGYGDVLPTNHKGEALAVILSVMGQFYQTILVGMLIGKYLFNYNMKRRDN